MSTNRTYLYLLLLPNYLLAAEPDIELAMSGTEAMYFEEMPVVISASRLSQPLNEAPVSTTVIDRQMIDASGAQTIPDLLRLVPGFTVGYLNGNSPVATYHGQSGRISNRLQLIIDGRSVYLPTQAGISWSDLVITIEDIDRLEVVRGPNASTYGNNAFLAVVSITTKHASEDKGHYIKGTVGSHDTGDAIYRFSGQANDLDYRVSVGTKNNSGTSLLDDSTETDYLSYRLDYQINLSTQLYYSGGLQDSEYGDVLEIARETSNDVEVTTAFQHLKLEHSFDSGNSLAIQYYYNFTKSFNSEYLSTVSLSDLGPPLTNIDDFDVYTLFNLESERHDLEVSYYYNPLDSLRLVSGGSVRSDKIIAENVFDPNTNNTLMLYRFFTHGEFRITNDFIINAGVMVEDNDISGTDVAPRLAFIYHLSTQHSFRLSASQATRTPTIFDENGYVALRQQLTQDGGQPLNNPPLEAILGGDVANDTLIYTSGNVKSEEITSFELGWMAQLLNNKLTLDVKLFMDETDKLISDVQFVGNVPTENADDLFAAFGLVYPDAGAQDSVNAASTKTRGVEFYSNYNFAENWRLYSYFAYVEISAKITNFNLEPVDQSQTVGKLEESIPKRSLGAMLMKQWENNLNTSLSIYYVDDMDWLDRTHDRVNPGQEYRDRSAEAYTRIDIIIRKSSKTSWGQVDYSLILQNLAGTYFDYTRTNYIDPTRQTINVPGSEQDPRGYFELAFKFY
jgi:iron complex outermembrane recepter protein